MSKMIKVFLLVLIFSSYMTFLTPSVFAVTCEASGLEYEPKFFPENSSSIILNFTIKDKNTLANLKSKYARLNIKRTLQLAYESDSVQITGDKFSLEVKDSGLKQRDRHTGHLYLSDDDKSFSEFCGEIAYQVGVGDQCIIDPSLPSSVPPNSSLTIKFFGDANTEYGLRLTTGGSTVASTKTDNQGQGQFDNATLAGKNGDKLTLTIYRTGGRSENQCVKEIILNVTAAQPTSPTPGPITITTPPGAPRSVGPPTTSGGPDTQCGSTNDPGIRTAIGCIHTSPVGFIKDFLKFFLGIAGGLAFLMMLLGAFQMLTSAGNPETLNAGKDRLTSAVIGLLFVIFSVLLLQIIGVDILGIPGFKEPI